MNILITGSRKITNVLFVFDKLNKHINKELDIIIHGGANGVDSIVESWCKQYDVKSIIIRPIYPTKREYYLYRNTEMVGMCDKCFAFWDGKSRGTKFTYQYATKRGKIVQVFKEGKDENR